jgi:hypothetical protein
MAAWEPPVSSDLNVSLAALRGGRYSVYWNDRNTKDVVEIATKHYQATGETLAREHVVGKCVESLIAVLAKSKGLTQEEKEAYSAEVQVQYRECVEWDPPPMTIYLRWAVLCPKSGFERIQFRSVHISTRK